MAAVPQSHLGILPWVWGVGCACILCAIFLAGFWPFCAPKNQVAWLSGQNGLRFGGRGIAFGERPFQALSPEGPVTLEICLLPASLSGSGTILAFNDFANPNYVFALRQFDGALAVQRPAYDPQGTLVRQWWATRGVFTATKPTVLTITSARDKGTLYVDGVLAGISREHANMSVDMVGTLVLGSSVVRDGWRGQISGLAIYNSLLTPAEIESHSIRWLQQESPVADGGSPPAALYRFNEGTGSTVYDEAAPANDALNIPARYLLVHPKYLTPLWDPFRSRWDGWRTTSYWSDVAVNITGFVPFGYFFAAWFSLIRSTSRPRMAALFLGIAVSFLIESVQYFLPTRDSSMTDLLTNSIGAAIGASMYRNYQMAVWIRRREVRSIAEHFHSI
jgi:hypothetical protein